MILKTVSIALVLTLALTAANSSFGGRTSNEDPALATSVIPLGKGLYVREAGGNFLGPALSGPGGAERTVSTLASYNFDDGAGGPDAQGWTSADLTEQPQIFFHVDDFAGLGGALSPLAGTKSFWCGTRAEGDYSHYSGAGYGNFWRQIFEYTGDLTGGNRPLTFSFLARYDLEPGVDFLYVEYSDASDTWAAIDTITGTADTTISITVDPLVVPNDVRSFRIRVETDASWSNEDSLYVSDGGAVIIDNVFIKESGIPVASINFELATVGSTSPARFWEASIMSGFGDHAALFDGSQQVQEDSAKTENSHLWAFINGSPDTYACGGWPLQPSVPMADSDNLFNRIRNEIRSPQIALNPLGAADQILIHYDVYADLPTANGVAFDTRARFLVAGVWTAWHEDGFAQVGNAKEWRVHGEPFNIPPGATDVQVAIQCRDICLQLGLNCGAVCHTHAPLIDNVAIVQTTPSALTTFTVVNGSDSGVGSLRQAILDANAAPDTNLIRFDTIYASKVWIQPITELPAITEPVIIDGFTEPLSAPNTNGAGEGLNAAYRIILSGVLSEPGADGLVVESPGVTIRGLCIQNFPGNGITMTTTAGSTVEGCYIGTDYDGMGASPNFGSGILMQGGNTVGGTDPAARNLISGNTSHGVEVSGGTGGCIVGNLIGTNAAGTAAIGNDWGINADSVTSLVIGGHTDAERNVCSGNVIGVNIDGGPVDVFGNYLGTDITGQSALPNTWYGVKATRTAGSQIGNITGGGNRIAFNTFQGVVLPLSSVGMQYSVRGNSMEQNGSDAILVFITPPFSAPTITSATITGDTITMTGTAHTGGTGLSVDVDFYANELCDGGGTGEGKTYIGTGTFVSAGGDYANFSHTQLWNGGANVITAIGVHGGQNSQFSVCETAINTPVGTSVAVAPVDSGSGATPATLTFDDVTVEGYTTLSSDTTGVALPGSFLPSDGNYYNFETTATFTGDIEICIHYDESTIPGGETNARLLHYDDVLLSWVDITTGVDTANDIVCGTTSSLSPFVIGGGSVTAVGDESGAPARLALGQNYPNPFNPTTTITYSVPAAGADVLIVVYDVTGRRIRQLVNGRREAGVQRVSWDGRDGNGRGVATGLYFFRMTSDDFVETRKMLLVK